jgi:hypothetical protein
MLPISNAVSHLQLYPRPNAIHLNEKLTYPKEKPLHVYSNRN